MIIDGVLGLSPAPSVVSSGVLLSRERLIISGVLGLSPAPSEPIDGVLGSPPLVDSGMSDGVLGSPPLGCSDGVLGSPPLVGSASVDRVLGSLPFSFCSLMALADAPEPEVYAGGVCPALCQVGVKEVAEVLPSEQGALAANPLLTLKTKGWPDG